MTIVGYGTENGVDYWLIRNSWGKGWGDGGYFKVKRGCNIGTIGRYTVKPICESLGPEPTDPPGPAPTDGQGKLMNKLHILNNCCC